MNAAASIPAVDFFEIEKINGLQDLWKQTTGNENICIAIIDGRADLDHPCFRNARLRHLHPFGVQSRDGSMAMQHGTAVASILFGQHGSPVQGIAPGCRGIIIPVFRDNEYSVEPCSQLDLARAIDFAADNGANIINISGGEFSNTGEPEAILSKTIEHCIKKGILVVAAAGNEGCDCLHIPAATSNVLAVGAMDENGEPLRFSNWGVSYQSNGLLFPGKNIRVAEPGNNTAIKTGTSFATPLAAGIAGLLMSILIKNGKPADGRLVFDTLIKTAHKCSDDDGKDCKKVLAGHLNLPAAVRAILGSCQPGHEDPEQANGVQPSGVKFPQSPWPKNPLPPAADHTSSSPDSIPNQTINTSNMVQISDAELATGTLLPATGIAGEPVSPAASEATPAQAGVFPSCGCNSKTESPDAPTSCGCGGKTDPVKVYAIGTISHEFQSEANRDAFTQDMNGGNPDDPTQLINYLRQNPEAAEDVVWTLNADATPMYAIYPAGGYASIVYQRIIEFYQSQLRGDSQRVSIPGYIGGKTHLMSGQEIPVLVPKGQGMYSWSTEALVKAVLGDAPKKPKTGEKGVAMVDFDSKQEGLNNFLNRVYYELRNFGISSQDRALNFAATNAFNAERVFERTANAGTELDTIEVDKSPICRPGSDCWDVKLTFFNPLKRTEEARRVYRFTVDVSHVIPVSVGPIRSWSIY